MHSGKLSLGLIVSFLVVFVYHPQAWAQNQRREASLELKQITQDMQHSIKIPKRKSRQQISSKLSLEKHEHHGNVSKLTNNSDVEQFDHVDENNKKERTFPFITNFISNLMHRRTCVYPCTLEAFQESQCCPPEILEVPVPIPAPHCNTCNSPPFPQPFQPNFSPQLPGSLPNPFPIPSINSPRTPQNFPFPYAPPFALPFQGQFIQPFPCCAVCTQYTFYGPPPCQFFGRSIA